MSRQLSRQRFNCSARQDMGKIDDPPGQRRDIQGMCKKSEGAGRDQGEDAEEDAVVPPMQLHHPPQP